MRKNRGQPWIINRVGMIDIAEFMRLYERTDHRRLRVFARKGVACISCGLAATHMIVWVDFHLEGKGDNLHIDLIAVTSGGDILMTVDHRQPVSKGGGNEIENCDPMCAPCNFKKGDKYEDGRETKVA